MDQTSEPQHAGVYTRRSVLAGAAAVGVAGSLPVLAARPARPHILFILADDLGFADLSCYGRRDFRTPVLDGLAADGVQLRQAYSSSAVCSPTRVALATGRYHQRLEVGLEEPIKANAGQGLPAGHPTLASLLQRAGYRTSLVGKWHLGWPPEHGPLQHGYDRFFGVPPGGTDYFTHRRPGAPQAAPGDLYEGDAPVRRPGYLTDLLAERAVEEIRAGAAAGTPLLLSLHFTAPHWPWEGPGDAATSATLGDLWHRDGGSLETYAAMVRAMDAAIGRVLAQLQRSGVADHTLVVFTSDNGGERYSDTWPLRGMKGELLEGGIRVPALVRWPGRIRRGTQSDQVMSTMDWLPTLAAAAGAPLDPAFPPDGEDLLAVLRGTAPPRPRRLFWRMQQQGQLAARDGDWKFLRMDGQESLHHLARDPRERADLRAKEPAVFARLKAEAEAWSARMRPYPPAGKDQAGG